MQVQARSGRRTGLVLPTLAAGFASVVAMWLVGYVTHLPGISVPPAIVLPVILACVVAGGVMVGRFTAGTPGGSGAAGSGLTVGAATGFVAGIVNLLVVGSLIAGDEPNEIVPSAMVWIPGSIVVSVVLGAIGGALGRGVFARAETLSSEAWRSVFVTVGLVATLMVVIAGGIVTSTETGLAVTDWPNSFGSNMFLYPLSRMTGGIYFEHAHRLYGALVGLTTIVLAVVLWLTDRRGSVRVLALSAVVMVIVQGVLGGLRVDSALSFSMDPSDTVPNLRLAILHGVLGQVFFALMSVIWTLTLPAWRTAPRLAPGAASTDRTISVALLVFVVIQLVFGAMYRHISTPEQPLPWPAHIHLTGAAIVAVLAYLAGLRAWGKYPDQPVLRRTGLVILASISAQLLLGLAALVAVMARKDAVPPPVEVILATGHQANGAILFAAAAQLVVWLRRG